MWVDEPFESLQDGCAIDSEVWGSGDESAGYRYECLYGIDGAAVWECMCSKLLLHLVREDWEIEG